MAKRIFTMNNFSGGVNNLKDARDISTNEFAYLNGFVVDQDGALKPIFLVESHDGLIAEPEANIRGVIGSVRKSGGNNLAYMESDMNMFFSGGSAVGTIATTTADIDFVATQEPNVGVGETTVPLRKGTS